MNDYQKILQILDSHTTFALSTHVNPDGDALGSELALYSFLTDRGKKVEIFNTDPTPGAYQFLPFVSQILSAEAFEGNSPEILVVLDAGELKRIGEDLSRVLVPTRYTVNIDHHATADSFGDYNLVKSDASSTCEIIYQLIRQYGAPVGTDRALCLYTGIMFDTGCFRYSNATPAAHRIAAELIAEGVPADEVYRLVYESAPIGKIRLLNEVLTTLEITADGKIAWIYATQEMLRTTKTTREDLDGFINYVRSIDTVEVAILVSEQEDRASKASLRSKSFVDVGEIAAEFDGGGHARAAGCEFSLPYQKTIEQLVKSAQKRLKSVDNAD